ncbi:MAG: hypothetical protein V4673_17185 [Pseudomonadota bacterium]
MAISLTDRLSDPAATMTTLPPNAPVVDAAMAARRASARRTAFVVAGISLVVYVTFIVLNAVGQ